MISKKTLRPSERVVSGEVTPGLITRINVKEMSQDGGLQKERRWRTLPDTCCSWARVPRPGTVLGEVLLSGGVLGDDAGPTG
jgi:hypothetical protein